MNKTSLRQNIAAITLTLSAFGAAAQTPAPFNISVRNYAYVGKTGYNANVARITLHKTTNPSASDGGFDTGQVVTFTNSVPAQDLNGAGISSQDGFLYALEYLYAGPFSTSAKFFRVGTNAVATQVGIIPAPTSSDAGRSVGFSFVNLASGTVDSAGNYWFTGYTYTDMNLPLNGSKVDMFLGKISGINSLTPSASTTLSPTYYKLDISDSLIQRGFTNLMTQQAAMIAYLLPPTNADGGWQDMDIHPVTKEMYSYIGFPSAPSTIGLNPYPKPGINSWLIRVDKSVAPWKVVRVNTLPNTSPNREEDGAFFDAAGNFHVGFTDGQYATINLSTGALTTLNQSSLPLYQSNLRGDFATNTPLVMPLPVLLSSFEGKEENGGNLISWTSDAEIYTDRIELQRSADAMDFSTIASFAPEGHGSTYRYLDAGTSGRVYYRLKMLNLRGEAEYSFTIKVDGRKPDVFTTVYPTVVSDGRLNILADAAQVKMSIYNLNGQLMQTALFNENMAGTPLQARLTLLSGTYFVRVSNAQSGECLLNTAVIIQ